jgi:hypothetical protein
MLDYCKGTKGSMDRVPHHSYSRAYGRPQRLRRLPGEPILYMGDLQCIRLRQHIRANNLSPTGSTA